MATQRINTSFSSETSFVKNPALKSPGKPADGHHMEGVFVSEVEPGPCARTPLSVQVSCKAEAESLLAEIAENTADRDMIVAELAGKMAALREKLEPAIQALDSIIETQRTAIETWAWAAQKEHFTDKRSLELAHGVIGFRWGPRKLALLSKQKWEVVLGRLRGKLSDYIRTKEEPNKDQILRDSTGDQPILSSADLSALGLKVVQEEGFFIELRR